MRVTIIQPSLPRYRAPVYRELASREGIELTIAYASEKHLASVEADGFTAEPVRAREMRLLGQRLVWSGASLAWADPSRTDVLVLPWHTRDLALLPAMRRARKRGLGVVLWGHGYSKREGKLRKWLRDRVTGRAHAIMFYNAGAARAFVEHNGRADDVFVALNALDQKPIRAAAEVWQRDGAKLDAFRREQGLGDRTVLFVSRLFEENRVDMLIRAMAEIRRRVEGASLAIVGDGPDAPRLRELVERLGLEDCVKMPGAIYGEENIAPWFCAARVFCYPVNIGLSILHAFGYGLPVVTSDARAAQNPEIEALEPGVNGLTYEDGDESQLATTLADLLLDDARLGALGEGALRTVGESFSLTNMVDGMEAAIRRAHAQRRTSSRPAPGGKETDR